MIARLIRFNGPNLAVPAYVPRVRAARCTVEQVARHDLNPFIMDSSLTETTKGLLSAIWAAAVAHPAIVLRVWYCGTRKVVSNGGLCR